MRVRPGLIALGKVVRARGVRGEVKILSYLDSSWDLRAVEGIYLRRGEGSPRYLRLEQVKGKGPVLFLKFHGIDSREAVESLLGAEVCIPREEAPSLPPDTYYHYDIIGLEVVDRDGRNWGRVVDVFPTPANDVYVVEKGGREWLLPATREVIKEVDLEGNCLRVHLLEGLVEAEEV